MTEATVSVAIPYDWSDVARLQAQKQLSEDRCGTACSPGAASTRIATGSKRTYYPLTYTADACAFDTI